VVRGAGRDGCRRLRSSAQDKRRYRLVPLNSSSSRSASDPASGSKPSRVEPLVRTTAIEFNPDISPDGRYIAYQSNESGRDEIYVRPFPRVNDGRWQVSTGGGTRPAWARSGRELFYVDLANTLTAVSVQTSEATFATGTPVKLFETAYAGSLSSPREYDVAPNGQRFLMLKENAARDRNATPGALFNLGERGTSFGARTSSYDLMRDGQRFLVARAVGSKSRSALTVVVNWPAALKT
jgi:WD40-like Beta Propeller Repeat